jgi:hypothetical protein
VSKLASFNGSAAPNVCTMASAGTTLVDNLTLCRTPIIVCTLLTCFFVCFVPGLSMADPAAPDLEGEEAAPVGGEVESSDQLAVGEQDHMRVGGALRFNAFSKSWDAVNHDKHGDFIFEVFRISADGSSSNIDLSLDYRFYSGYNMLRYGYFGHTFDSEIEFQIGVSRKPFGLLPYTSHSWFFNIAYYIGMEDDADAGVKVLFPGDQWDLQLAFYKSSEGSYNGGSIASARYSYDIVSTNEDELGYAGLVGSRTNEEVNQLNARLAYKLTHSTLSETEIGLSGEYGGLYNGTTREMGDHWAAAAHLNGTYGRIGLMLEAVGFDFNPKNPSGQDNRFVVRGAFDAPYKVAAKGSMFLASVSYMIPIEGPTIDHVMLYNDFSYLAKDESAFENSQQNVLGALIAAGGLYTYIDFAFGKNHPWIGPNYGSSLAEGDLDANWELRFNINMGYYF